LARVMIQGHTWQW